MGQSNSLPTTDDDTPILSSNDELNKVTGAERKEKNETSEGVTVTPSSHDAPSDGNVNNDSNREQDPVVQDKMKKVDSDPPQDGNNALSNNTSFATDHSTEKNTARINIDIILKELQALSMEEVIKRVQYATFTRQNILQIAKSHSDDLTFMYKKQNITQPLSNRETEEELALLLLQISPEIRTLRYKLVPSKLREGMFWGAIFRSISNHNLDEVEKAYPSFDCDSRCDSKVPEPSTEQNELNMGHIDSEIKKRLDDALSRIQELESLLSQKNMGSPASFRSHKQCHRGRWIIDKDCQDFLSLDGDLKNRLREGKKKRMQEVMDELRFILDTDDVREARGRWDCCGKKDYFMEGCS